VARRAILTGLGLLCASLTLGCGDGLAEVSGTVTVDDRPLQEGEIIFEEADQSKSPAAGPIVGGKYTVQVPPGSKKVRINASRPTKKPDPVLGAAARESMIAPEFNERTRLTAEIKPGKQDGVNFAVQGTP
jgi:hypothetical protein